MRPLTTGIRSEKWVVRRFRRRANVNLHKPRQYSIANYTPRLYQWRTQEFFRGGEGVQKIQLRKEDRQNGDLGGGSPLVRGSGGSCNLVQEISFHIVKSSLFLVL